MGYSYELVMAFSRKGRAKLHGMIEDLECSPNERDREMAVLLKDFIESESDSREEKDGALLVHWSAVYWDRGNRAAWWLKNACETDIPEEDWSVLLLGEDEGDVHTDGCFADGDECPFYLYTQTYIEYGVRD